jgi:hypothetical protein
MSTMKPDALFSVDGLVAVITGGGSGELTSNLGGHLTKTC